MRKNYYYMLFAIAIMGCESAEELVQENKSKKNQTQTYIINGDIVYEAEITDGSKPKNPIFIYDIPDKTNKDLKDTTNKTLEQSVVINFGYPYGSPTNSGCTIKRYNDGNSYYTDSGVFGYNSYQYPYPSAPISHTVRGYGTPHLNAYYGSLVLFVGNKGKKTYNRYGEWHDNDQNGSAISIEYPFKANTTYEISINTVFHDNRYLVDKVYSIGYPTLYVQLKNDGIIQIPYTRSQDQDPCTRNGIIDLNENAFDYLNYTRTYTLDSRAVIQRTLSFKFSPTEEKKALLISLHPSISNAGYEAPIYTNNYTMTMPQITITEKIFDPSLNIKLTPPTQGRR